MLKNNYREMKLEWQYKGVNFLALCHTLRIMTKSAVDIKTTSDAGKRFQRDLLYNDYKMQLAMYQDQFDKDTDVYIVAIETSNFNVQVYKLNEKFLLGLA